MLKAEVLVLRFTDGWAIPNPRTGGSVTSRWTPLALASGC